MFNRKILLSGSGNGSAVYNGVLSVEYYDYGTNGKSKDEAYGFRNFGTVSFGTLSPGMTSSGIIIEHLAYQTILSPTSDLGVRNCPFSKAKISIENVCSNVELVHFEAYTSRYVLLPVSSPMSSAYLYPLSNYAGSNLDVAIVFYD